VLSRRSELVAHFAVEAARETAAVCAGGQLRVTRSTVGGRVQERLVERASARRRRRWRLQSSNLRGCAGAQALPVVMGSRGASTGSAWGAGARLRPLPLPEWAGRQRANGYAALVSAREIMTAIQIVGMQRSATPTPVAGPGGLQTIGKFVCERRSDGQDVDAGQPDDRSCRHAARGDRMVNGLLSAPVCLRGSRSAHPLGEQSKQRAIHAEKRLPQTFSGASAGTCRRVYAGRSPRIAGLREPGGASSPPPATIYGRALADEG
jgi:hypothetical protein